MSITKNLLVSDLDGTLLDSKRQISVENLEAIHTFKENGGMFTIATGRMEKAAIPYIEQLEINIPVILYNGAIIYDPINKKRIVEKHLTSPGEILRKINSLSKFDDVAVLIYQGDEVYTIKRNHIVEKYEEKENVTCQFFSERQLKNHIIKIMLIAEPEILKKFETKVSEEHSCELVYSEINYLEILPLGISKGAALKRLRFMIGMEKVNTICVGDNLNDLPMLEIADKGFFVENSHKLLVKNHFFSCVHHNEHAIADIIHNHILPVKM